MSNIDESDKSESNIWTSFKNMSLSAGIESDNLAVSWLEKHEKSFCGYVNGHWLNKEEIEKEVEVKFDHHKVCDYFSGKHLCDVYSSTDTNLLFYAAKNSASGFETWISLTSASRSKILFDIAQTIEKYKQLFAIVEAISSGKHVTKVREKDVPDFIESFNYYAGCALHLENLSRTWFRTGPVCVVAEEYNNPSLTLSLRVSSLLAAGNSVLLLSDVKSSLTSFLLAEICSKSGVPDGVLNVLPVDQAKLTTLGDLPIFSKLLFTGSCERSISYSKYCSKAHMPCDVLIPKRPVVIVYESADLYSAANGVLEALFYHDTRSKSSGCKVLIQESVLEEFLTILSDCFKKILVGRNLSKTDLSCIVTEEQKKVLTECIQQAAEINAKITSISDPENDSCSYTRMMPVLINNLQTNSKLVHEELGGPIIVAVPFRTVKESISMFNCDNKGSPVSIWNDKIAIALEVVLKLKTGVIWVNSENVIDHRISFNGVYFSGNSVEGGKEAYFNHMSTTVYTEDVSDQMNKYDAWLLSAKEMQNSAPALQAVKEGIKEYKLFIGGNFQRSGNGTIALNEDTFIPSGTASDIQSAVSSAVAAQPKWEIVADAQKRKIFFDVIAKLKETRQDYECELQKVSGSSLEACKTEVDETLDLLYYWASQNDKFNGPVQEIKKNIVVLQRRNPVGVIGIQCPDVKPLLSLVSLVMPAVVHGNAVVTIASSKYPTIALKMCEIFSSACVPGGVINIICGNKTRLVPALCKHMNIGAIWFTDVPPKVIYTNCNVTQRVLYCNEIWSDFNETKSLKCTMESTFGKSIFLPAGEIYAN